MSVTVDLELVTPLVPNFISLKSPARPQEGFQASQTIDVAMLTDEQLNALAVQWRDALIENAEKRRKFS